MKRSSIAVLLVITYALLYGAQESSAWLPPPSPWKWAHPDTFKIRSLKLNGQNLVKRKQAVVVSATKFQLKGAVDFPNGQPPLMMVNIIDENRERPAIASGGNIPLNQATVGRRGTASFSTELIAPVKPGSYAFQVLAAPYPHPAPNEDARPRILTIRELVVVPEAGGEA